MKTKVILMFMIVFMSNAAIASLYKVTSNEEAIIYADPSSIQKSGDLVKMWEVTDFKKKSNNDKYLSVKSLHEFDCKQNKSRVVNYSMYSQNMASGKVVQSSNVAHAWLPVRSGGITVALLATACKKH